MEETYQLVQKKKIHGEKGLVVTGRSTRICMELSQPGFDEQEQKQDDIFKIMCSSNLDFLK